jgi:hypothetical protein
MDNGEETRDSLIERISHEEARLSRIEATRDVSERRLSALRIGLTALTLTTTLRSRLSAPNSGCTPYPARQYHQW